MCDFRIVLEAKTVDLSRPLPHQEVWSLRFGPYLINMYLCEVVT